MTHTNAKTAPAKAGSVGTFRLTELDKRSLALALDTLRGDARVVARMRMEGKTYREIQAALGYKTKSAVWYYWRKIAVPTLRARSEAWKKLLAGE